MLEEWTLKMGVCRSMTRYCSRGITAVVMLVISRLHQCLAVQ
jgi:hypothetical protein